MRILMPRSAALYLPAGRLARPGRLAAASVPFPRKTVRRASARVTERKRN